VKSCPTTRAASPVEAAEQLLDYESPPEIIELHAMLLRKLLLVQCFSYC
jgi:hypothetical protein